MAATEEAETMGVDKPDPILEEPPVERTETAINDVPADLAAKISNLTERIQITLQHEVTEETDLPLILTGDKRRGVYECDFCRRDVSPFPRIRCATCVDFDLCLDCFASSSLSNSKTTAQQQHPYQYSWLNKNAAQRICFRQDDGQLLFSSGLQEHLHIRQLVQGN